VGNSKTFGRSTEPQKSASMPPWSWRSSDLFGTQGRIDADLPTRIFAYRGWLDRRMLVSEGPLASRQP
jgi:hypothetical protein